MAINNCLPLPEEITTQIVQKLPVASIVQFGCVSRSCYAARGSTWTSNLPLRQKDITTEIFKRLPVLSLVRITSVSKSCYCLICSRSFTAAHLSHQKSSKGTRYLGYVLNPENRDENLFKLFNETFSSYKLLSPPMSLPMQHYQMVGSCNGLICLEYNENLGESGGNICLWNPMIRKVRILPRCLTQYWTFFDYNVDFAFGFDMETSDYKVARFVYFKCNVYKKFHLEVYSLSSDSWKRILGGVNCKSAVSVLGDSYVSINGVIYWLAAKDRNINLYTGYADFIASFDMAREELREIPLPKSERVLHGRLSCISIVKFHESLALFYEQLGPHKGDFEREYDVWILQRSTSRNRHIWTKQFSICLKILPLRPRSDRISFTRDGRAVLRPYKGRMLSYDAKSNQCTSLGKTGVLLRSLDTFAPSLVLNDNWNFAPGFAKPSDKTSYAFPNCTEQRSRGGYGKKRKRDQRSFFFSSSSML